jgi:hypothetical protein
VRGNGRIADTSFGDLTREESGSEGRIWPDSIAGSGSAWTKPYLLAPSEEGI